MTDYKQHFPVTEKYIYFNHAAVSPLSSAAREYATKFLEDATLNGSMNYMSWLKSVAEAKSIVAKMLNADTDEIAIVKNTTSGILLVANGLNLKKGDNIIIPEREFPANVYPWLNLKKRGVDVKFVKWHEGRVRIDDIMSLVDRDTKLVSVSHVQFSNGYRININELGRRLKERGVLLFVDAIQSMGVFDIDVNRDNVDFLAADSHKWLLGPEGVGFFYCKKQNLEMLELVNFGYTSVINSSDYLNYDMTLMPNASRFEEGSLNMLGIHSALGSLKLIEDVSIDTICTRVLRITDLLAERLAAEGCQIKSPRDSEGEKSGIISFVSDKIPTKDLYSKLMQNNCYVALRDNAIRLSPHFYNSEEEVDRFIALLTS